MIRMPHLFKLKQKGEKFCCLTAYDASFSHLLSSLGIEVILVGDSLGMVMQGHDSTVPVTMEDMVYHTQMVARGNQGAMVMGDMPFMSYATPEQAMGNAARLMAAGAHIVKLEGGAWLAPTVRMLTERGIPVCGHLGLTPQSVHMLGGYKAQGKTYDQATRLKQDALALEASGAQLVVLECVPSSLAKEVTESLAIPVIGIGAGRDVDAQILVLQDMLGITPGKRPKFSRNFMEQIPPNPLPGQARDRLFPKGGTGDCATPRSPKGGTGDCATPRSPRGGTGDCATPRSPKGGAMDSAGAGGILHSAILQYIHEVKSLAFPAQEHEVA